MADEPRDEFENFVNEFCVIAEWGRGNVDIYSDQAQNEINGLCLRYPNLFNHPFIQEAIISMIPCDDEREDDVKDEKRGYPPFRNMPIIRMYRSELMDEFVNGLRVDFGMEVDDDFHMEHIKSIYESEHKSKLDILYLGIEVDNYSIINEEESKYTLWDIMVAET